MIDFDEVDFSECCSKEVISFFWRSVYFHFMMSACFHWEKKGGGDSIHSKLTFDVKNLHATFFPQM